MARKASSERGAAKSSTDSAPREGGRVLFSYRTNVELRKVGATVLKVHEGGELLDLEVQKPAEVKGAKAPAPEVLERVPMHLDEEHKCNTWRPIPVPTEETEPEG